MTKLIQNMFFYSHLYAREIIFKINYNFGQITLMNKFLVLYLLNVYEFYIYYYSASPNLIISESKINLLTPLRLNEC